MYIGERNKHEIVKILIGQNIPQLREIFVKYRAKYGHLIDNLIEKLFSGDTRDALLAIGKIFFFSR